MTTLIETMARAICACSPQGYCWAVGEHLGCKNGRGQKADAAKCVADPTVLRGTCVEWKIAQTVFSAIEAAGYRVVPLEPTAEMVAAFETPQVELPLGNGQTIRVHGMTHYADNVWRLMLAAAPKVTE